MSSSESKIPKHIHIKYWAIFNLSPYLSVSALEKDFIDAGRELGVAFHIPMACIEEYQETEQLPLVKRARIWDYYLKLRLPFRPEFVLCVLPSKDSECREPLERRLSELKIVSHFIAPCALNRRQYLDSELPSVVTKLEERSRMLNN